MRTSNFIRGGLRRFGYDICWAAERRDPFDDLKKLAPRSPVVFDVGANLGQSIELFRSTFQDPVIHAFEPGRSAFGALQRDYASPKTTVNNLALGAEKGDGRFIERVRHNLSSFLEAEEDFGAEAERCIVQIDTVDNYCRTNQISRIDILKSDTQGFELAVLNGAKTMLDSGRVGCVLVEMNFAEQYKGQSHADEIMKFMREHGFSLKAFYRFVYKNDRVNWTDALFEYDARKPAQGNS